MAIVGFDAWWRTQEGKYADPLERDNARRQSQTAWVQTNGALGVGSRPYAPHTTLHSLGGAVANEGLDARAGAVSHGSAFAPRTWNELTGWMASGTLTHSQLAGLAGLDASRPETWAGASPQQIAQAVQGLNAQYNVAGYYGYREHEIAQYRGAHRFEAANWTPESGNPRPGKFYPDQVPIHSLAHWMQFPAHLQARLQDQQLLHPAYFKEDEWGHMETPQDMVIRQNAAHGFSINTVSSSWLGRIGDQIVSTFAPDKFAKRLQMLGAHEVYGLSGVASESRPMLAGPGAKRSDVGTPIRAGFILNPGGKDLSGDIGVSGQFLYDSSLGNPTHVISRRIVEEEGHALSNWVTPGTTIGNRNPGNVALARGLRPMDVEGRNLTVRDVFHTVEPIYNPRTRMKEERNVHYVQMLAEELNGALTAKQGSTKGIGVAVGGLTSNVVDQSGRPLGVQMVSNIKDLQGMAYEIAQRRIGQDRNALRDILGVTARSYAAAGANPLAWLGRNAKDMVQQVTLRDQVIHADNREAYDKFASNWRDQGNNTYLADLSMPMLVADVSKAFSFTPAPHRAYVSWKDLQDMLAQGEGSVAPGMARRMIQASGSERRSARSLLTAYLASSGKYSDPSNTANIRGRIHETLATAMSQAEALAQDVGTKRMREAGYSDEEVSNYVASEGEIAHQFFGLAPNLTYQTDRGEQRHLGREYLRAQSEGQSAIIQPLRDLERYSAKDVYPDSEAGRLPTTAFRLIRHMLGGGKTLEEQQAAHANDPEAAKDVFDSYNRALGEIAGGQSVRESATGAVLYGDDANLVGGNILRAAPWLGNDEAYVPGLEAGQMVLPTGNPTTGTESWGNERMVRNVGPDRLPQGWDKDHAYFSPATIGAMQRDADGDLVRWAIAKGHIQMNGKGEAIDPKTGQPFNNSQAIVDAAKLAQARGASDPQEDMLGAYERIKGVAYPTGADQVKAALAKIGQATQPYDEKGNKSGYHVRGLDPVMKSVRDFFTLRGSTGYAYNIWERAKASAPSFARPTAEMLGNISHGFFQRPAAPPSWLSEMMKVMSGTYKGGARNLVTGGPDQSTRAGANATSMMWRTASQLVRGVQEGNISAETAALSMAPREALVPGIQDIFNRSKGLGAAGVVGELNKLFSAKDWLFGSFTGRTAAGSYVTSLDRDVASGRISEGAARNKTQLSGFTQADLEQMREIGSEQRTALNATAKASGSVGVEDFVAAHPGLVTTTPLEPKAPEAVAGGNGAQPPVVPPVAVAAPPDPGQPPSGPTTPITDEIRERIRRRASYVRPSSLDDDPNTPQGRANLVGGMFKDVLGKGVYTPEYLAELRNNAAGKRSIDMSSPDDLSTKAGRGTAVHREFSRRIVSGLQAIMGVDPGSVQSEVGKAMTVNLPGGGSTVLAGTSDAVQGLGTDNVTIHDVKPMRNPADAAEQAQTAGWHRFQLSAYAQMFGAKMARIIGYDKSAVPSGVAPERVAEQIAHTQSFNVPLAGDEEFTKRVAAVSGTQTSSATQGIVEWLMQNQNNPSVQAAIKQSRGDDYMGGNRELLRLAEEGLGMRSGNPTAGATNGASSGGAAMAMGGAMTVMGGGGGGVSGGLINKIKDVTNYLAQWGDKIDGALKSTDEVTKQQKAFVGKFKGWQKSVADLNWSIDREEASIDPSDTSDAANSRRQKLGEARNAVRGLVNQTSYQNLSDTIKTRIDPAMQAAEVAGITGEAGGAPAKQGALRQAFSNISAGGLGGVGWALFNAQRAWNYTAGAVAKQYNVYAGQQAQQQQVAFNIGGPAGLTGAPLDVMQTQASVENMNWQMGRAGAGMLNRPVQFASDAVANLPQPVLGAFQAARSAMGPLAQAQILMSLAGKGQYGPFNLALKGASKLGGLLGTNIGATTLASEGAESLGATIGTAGGITAGGFLGAAALPLIPVAATIAGAGQREENIDYLKGYASSGYAKTGLEQAFAEQGKIWSRAGVLGSAFPMVSRFALNRFSSNYRDYVAGQSDLNAALPKDQQEAVAKMVTELVNRKTGIGPDEATQSLSGIAGFTGKLPGSVDKAQKWVDWTRSLGGAQAATQFIGQAGQDLGVISGSAQAGQLVDRLSGLNGPQMQAFSTIASQIGPGLQGQGRDWQSIAGIVSSYTNSAVSGGMTTDQAVMSALLGNNLMSIGGIAGTPGGAAYNRFTRTLLNGAMPDKQNVAALQQLLPDSFMGHMTTDTFARLAEEGGWGTNTLPDTQGRMPARAGKLGRLMDQVRNGQISQQSYGFQLGMMTGTTGLEGAYGLIQGTPQAQAFWSQQNLGTEAQQNRFATYTGMAQQMMLPGQQLTSSFTNGLAAYSGGATMAQQDWVTSNYNSPLMWAFRQKDAGNYQNISAGGGGWTAGTMEYTSKYGFQDYGTAASFQREWSSGALRNRIAIGSRGGKWTPGTEGGAQVPSGGTTFGGGSYDEGGAPYGAEGAIRNHEDLMNLTKEMRSLNENMIHANREYQGQQIEFGKKRAQLSYQQGMEDVALQEKRFGVEYSFQKNEMQIQRHQFQVQTGWQRQDFSYQENMAGLQFGWSQEDLQRNMRFATGRERQQLRRQLNREQITYGMEEGQRARERGRFETQTQWQSDAMKRNEDQFEKLAALTREQFALQKKHLQENFALQMQELNAQQAHINTVNGLEDAMRKKQQDWEDQQQKNQAKDLENQLILVKQNAADFQAEMERRDTLMQKQKEMYDEQMKYIQEGGELRNAVKDFMRYVEGLIGDAMNKHYGGGGGGSAPPGPPPDPQHTHWDPQKQQWYATGGIVATPQKVGVGDVPEAIIPLQVLPQILKDMGGASGGGSTEITIKLSDSQVMELIATGILKTTSFEHGLGSLSRKQSNRTLH
jgi:hypothetical protein